MRAMPLGDVGEFRLIEALARLIAGRQGRSVERTGPGGFRVRLGIGDDAAAWSSDAGVSVATTDTLVEGVHFRLEWTGWRDLGWKSMAASLSDVAAMGCSPTAGMVTLGLRGDHEVDDVLELYRGMLDACDRSGGAIVGGDVVRSPVLFVTVAMNGTAPAGRGPAARLLTRDSASVGDRIAVTGSLGCAAGGLRMMSEGLSFDAETTRHLRDAHNRPVPRTAEGASLVCNGVVTGMDISDGLVSDLSKLCAASGVAARVDAGRVPIDDVLRSAFPGDCLALALAGGEEYELLFTASADVISRARRSIDVRVSVIGEVVEGPPGVTVMNEHGDPLPLGTGGWDHFRGARAGG